jgi:hypothetical protein
VWIVGVFLFLAGAAATAWAMWALDHSRRPNDVALALLAPVTTLISLVGLLLIFVPDFLR